MTTLSDAQIASYGLPRRPNPGDVKGMALWRHMLRGVHQLICAKPVNAGWTSMPGKVRGADTTTTSTSISPETASGTNVLNDTWSGIQVFSTSGSQNMTEGEWHLPCYVYANSPSQSTATEWVGIGGVQANNLLQAGTESDPRYGYQFWYELYTGSSSTAQFIPWPRGPVCGDDIVVKVSYSYDVAYKSYIWLEDLTKGFATSYTFSFTPDKYSSEWITERVSFNGGSCASQLADFDLVNWVNAVAASYGLDGGSHEPISAFNNSNYYWQYVIMNDRDFSQEDLAGPYTLGSDGKSFTDAWFDNGTYEGC